MSRSVDTAERLLERVTQLVQAIYGDSLAEAELDDLPQSLMTLMRLELPQITPAQHVNHWDQSSTMMITYGDSFQMDGEKPLSTLKNFLDGYTEGTLRGVHILPFYPWSSDDGFAVLDYSSVNESLGDWRDIEAIAQDYDLMADLVINHCSSRSLWFQNYLKNEEPGKDFFFSASPDDDLSAVVRPRTTPLLREVEAIDGRRHVWCTFSPDQVDLDFGNPEVLKQFVAIIRQYLDSGIRIFRLDAVAFMWKIPGTNCLNLPETHELVRLLRTLIEHARPDGLLITETNIPNRENLSYFGNANEAHCIYNFSLPPLLLHTLVSGDCSYLKQWMMSMPPAQNGTAYFNFVASHDGIGLRPAEGLLSESELDRLIKTMTAFGGHISYRDLEGGGKKPYEINISLFDALQGSIAGADTWGEDRFICAHAIMLGLEGIPAIYVHSLMGTRNDYQRVHNTGHYRAINRHQWDFEQLTEALADDCNHHARIFSRMKALLAIRIRQAAFHPNATQFTLHLGTSVFGFWRQSIDRRQSIFCINNVTKETQSISMSDINMIDSQNWLDLISRVSYTLNTDQLVLKPYQTVWITNTANHDAGNSQNH